MCLKDILSFEISPVPYSLPSVNGSFRKGTKSVFCRFPSVDSFKYSSTYRTSLWSGVASEMVRKQWVWPEVSAGRSKRCDQTMRGWHQDDLACPLYAAQSNRGLVIQSPDIDVLDFSGLDCRDCTGVKVQHRLISVDDIVHVFDQCKDM